MGKLNVAPTKSNLLALKRQLAFAEEGYELLEQKRQILIAELMRRLARVLDARSEAVEALRRAFDALSEAQLDAGSEALDRASLAVDMDHKVELSAQQLMGMKIPRVKVRTEPLSVQFGVGGTSGECRRCHEPFCRGASASRRVGGAGKWRDAAGYGTSQDTAALQCALQDLHAELPGNDRLYHRRPRGTGTGILRDPEDDSRSPSSATFR